MNELLTISNDAVRVVAWTLLHFFWQGALVAGVLAAVLAFLRRGSSQARYGVACVALVAMAALPLATGLWLSRAKSVPSFSTGSPAAELYGAGESQAERVAGTGAGAGAASTVPAQAALGGGQMRSLLDPALPWLVVLWLSGVVALSGVHLGGWVRVRRLRRRGVQPAEQRWRHATARLARQLGIRRPVELLASTRVAVPAAIGWLKPVVLFPASTFTGLEPRQLESILAHELAHIRRHDYLINVLQVALETLLFYHPAVWWASRQVRELREHCCDDLAVAVCGDRMTYARALADLEELRFAAPVFALGADGGSLLERVRRLAGPASAAPARAPGWMAPASAAVALAASAAVLALAGRPGFAQEDEVGIGTPTLLPPVIIAQLEDEQGASGSTPQEDPRASSVESPPEPAASDPRRGDPIPLDELIQMKMHGLDDLLDEVEGTAYASLPTRQLLELARFGVDRELIAELDAAGYGKLPVVELVELAKFGVDGDYVQEMRAAGYAVTSTRELVELAKFGVDDELIRELAAAGFDNLATLELVELAKFGVDGDYVQEMRGAGYQVTSIEGLVELAKFGVDGELIAELAELGYRDLAAGEITELAKFGVDGDFIRELRDAGYDNLSVDDLARMARHGIDAEFLSKMSERNRI